MLNKTVLKTWAKILNLFKKNSVLQKQFRPVLDWYRNQWFAKINMGKQYILVIAAKTPQQIK